MTALRHALLIGVPLAFSVLLWFHPMISDYNGLRDVTARFQIVHVGMVLALPLLAIGIHGLLDGLRGRAAAVGRFAQVPIVAYYVPASATPSPPAWSRTSPGIPSSASPVSSGRSAPSP